jgi:hypothetical protein
MKHIAVGEHGVPSTMPLHPHLPGSLQRSGTSGGLMKATIICMTLVFLVADQGAEKPANHRIALLSRVACPAVREAVKLYGEAAAEQWARSHGVSETKIGEAKRCLK